LIALLSAIVEIRIDGYKLVNCCRRPFPYNTPGLGVWVNVLDLFSMLAVLNNVAMCVWLTDWPSRCFSQPIETITTRDKILLILTISGILGIVLLLVRLYIHDVHSKSNDHYQRQLYVAQILSAGQELQVEAENLEMSSIASTEGLTFKGGCCTRFFRRNGSQKLEILISQSRDNTLRTSKLHAPNHNENGLMCIPRWKTLLVTDTMGQFGKKGASSIEFVESEKTNQHKEKLFTPLLPFRNVEEIQVESPSAHMTNNSKTYDFGCTSKNNSGLQFDI